MGQPNRRRTLQPALGIFHFGRSCDRSDDGTHNLALVSNRRSLTALTSTLGPPDFFGRAGGALTAIGELSLTLGYAGAVL